MNIFISNISFKVREQSLQELFSQFGEVSNVRIIKDKETRRSKGYGFVEMPNDEEALKAIEELNGATVDGRTIVVNKSEPKPEGERKSYNNSRGGDSRGGYGGGTRGGY